MKSKKLRHLKAWALGSLTLCFASCSLPTDLQKSRSAVMPETYSDLRDTTNTGSIVWRDFFHDKYLTAIIDTALRNNQEMNIMLAEISIMRNEVMARRGEYLPFLGLFAGGGVEKVGRYTSQGANDANTEIMPGREFPDPLPDVSAGVRATWEVDIWNKLRNARRSAVLRYLATEEARKFMVTNLVAEIAESYYDLLALDNQLEILQQNITIQNDALSIMRMEKSAAKVTELAVRKYEAEVFKNRSLVFSIRQRIIETENRINLLAGRFPQSIPRDSKKFLVHSFDSIYAGSPAQLLSNRPDVRQAEKELMAAKLDVKSARAMFYPSLSINAALGYRAFSPGLLFTTPQSLVYSLAGDLMAPLLNRNGIKSAYYSASSRQLQKVYNYERTILNAFVETTNQISNIRNMRGSLDLKSQQVDALNKCINISTVLFKSARADYMEVLMTQRDALDSKFELVETKAEQIKAHIGLYKALGGGWR